LNRSKIIKFPTFCGTLIEKKTDKLAHKVGVAVPQRGHKVSSSMFISGYRSSSARIYV